MSWSNKPSPCFYDTNILCDRTPLSSTDSDPTVIAARSNFKDYSQFCIACQSWKSAIRQSAHTRLIDKIYPES